MTLSRRYIATLFCLVGMSFLYAQRGPGLSEKPSRQDSIVLSELAWKLSPHFSGNWLEAGHNEETILAAGVAFPALRRRLQDCGLNGRVIREYPEAGALLLRLSPEEVVRHILPLEEVVFIDRRGRKPEEERAVRGFDLSVNKVNALHAHYPEYRGTGQVISVKEDRFDSTDIDFSGRVVPSALASDVQSSHATTMASMIAGGGNTCYTGKGVAWGAGISSSSFLNVFPDELAYFESAGIEVQNHSYGLDIENYYGAEALAYDQQVFQDPSLVHVFSAGNRGDSTSQAGPYAGVAGFANLTGNFKMAKNVLTVGPVDSLAQVAPRGSRGPAYDGRVKPELAAFGDDGSSGAAAVTSGLVALLQEAYLELNGGAPPPSALLRAILLNSADDIGPPGPDYRSGYGNVNALGAMETLLEGRYFSGSLVPGASISVALEVPENALNLKLTLAWTDPPAMINAGTALVNDLDLRLAKGGEQWLPWALSTYPHPDSLGQPARRQAVHLDNQEQVTIAAPAAGVYEAVISTTSLHQGPQDFFVAYQWDTAGHFQWIFPTYADNARSGNRQPVRWESAGNVLPGVLEYRLLGTEDWLTISEEVGLETGYSFWEAPDTIARAQLRMRTAGREMLSDTFTLSAPPEMELGFECSDSLLLHWNGQASADSFLVFELNAPYMAPLMPVRDTFIVIDTRQHPGRFFAVAPFTGSPPALGARSFALNLDFQFAGCYLQNFLADLQGEEVVLKLSLGASYQVDSLAFEKEQDGEFFALAAFASEGELEAEYIDQALREGLNVYRAAVVLTSGTRIYSEPVSVLFTKAAHFLFPNPVFAGQEIYILSKAPADAYFSLYDALGRLLLEYPLASSFEPIPTQTLARGIYHYQVVAKGEQRAKGKLVLR